MPESFGTTRIPNAPAQATIDNGRNRDEGSRAFIIFNVPPANASRITSPDRSEEQDRINPEHGLRVLGAIVKGQRDGVTVVPVSAEFVPNTSE